MKDKQVQIKNDKEISSDTSNEQTSDKRCIKNKCSKEMFYTHKPLAKDPEESG